MAEDNTQERTEQATPKHLKEARERGQVARSREFNTMAVLLTASTGVLWLGPRIVQDLAQAMRTRLHFNHAQLWDAMALPAALGNALEGALVLLAPFLVLIGVVALLAPLALGGLPLSLSALAFKWERLDPLKGLGRLFSLHGLVELLKALGKFALIALSAGVLLWKEAPRLLALGSESPRLALGDAAHLIAWAFLILTLPLILLAVLDAPWQLWQYAKQLRMTRQELREELKDTEGRPEVKGRLRRLQQELARRRMLTEVPRADVIVTNPSHYAVVLLYRSDQARAPIVVAKGMDWLALQIRTLGAQHGVPLIESPVLARALYYNTDLDREIPAGLYLAVAQVLAYVYQMRRRGLVSERPIPMPDLPVPDDLRRA
jgi:flagellar biosynthetic protein FlhB